MRTSTFSAGLQFTAAPLSDVAAGEATDGAQDGGPSDSCTGSQQAAVEETRFFATEEERLLWKAARLRRSIETELLPRQEEAERALRMGRRQLAAVQRQLPSVAFLAFRSACASQGERLRLFEGALVHSLLKQAVSRAVTSGELAEPARWRKSNQWPALTTFVELQLHVGTALTADAADGSLQTPPPPRETHAVDVHLLAVWTQIQDTQLTRAFLESYYNLKDALHGWGGGWYVRASCRDDHGDGGSTAAPTAARGGSDTRRCPFSVWESLSDMERLSSYSTLCPRHLTEGVVDCLDRLLVVCFKDVWRYVDQVNSASTGSNPL